MKYLCAAFLFLSIAVSAQAEEKIWVAFVKADNYPTLEGNRLEKYQSRLKSVFGFEDYHLLHEAMVPMGQKYEQWVLPRKDFYLKVIPLGNPKGVYTVKFEVYHEKTLVISGQFRPTATRPLFINGPDYQDGRLLFLLQIISDSVPAK